jgi:hypothetical protein
MVVEAGPLLEVGPDAEGALAGPGQHHRPDPGIDRQRLHGRGQVQGQLGRDRVEGLGPVEGDGGHPPGHLHPYQPAHRRFTRRRCRR